MLTDGIELIGSSKALNFSIDSGPSLPETGNNDGELFLLTGVGLHVYSGGDWTLIGAGGAEVTPESIEAALGYEPAALDGSGKVLSSQLPAIAITDTYVVSSQAQQLALTAEIGDVAVRTDINKSFILRVAGPSTLANWQELLTPTDTVSSVNGQTGAVSLTTSNVAEGSNEYFTDERARAAISVSGAGGSYNAATGVITIASTAVEAGTLTGASLAPNVVAASLSTIDSATSPLTLKVSTTNTSITGANRAIQLRNTSNTPASLNGLGFQNSGGFETATIFVTQAAGGTNVGETLTLTTKNGAGTDYNAGITISNGGTTTIGNALSITNVGALSINGNAGTAGQQLTSGGPNSPPAWSTGFSGAYADLTGKPTLFDGTWASLSGKPTISGTNTGDQTITLTGDVTGSGTGSFAATLASVGTAGTYRSVTTDAKGRVTAGTNPTTLAGYGITDAMALAGGTFTGNVLQTGGTFKHQHAGVGGTVVAPGTAGNTGYIEFFNASSVAQAYVGNTPTNGALKLHNYTGNGFAFTGGAVAISGAISASNLSGTNTGDQTITLTGDVTGTGTGSFATTLASVGTPGTYRSVTTDAKGRVTAGTNPTTLAGYGITDALPLAGGTVTALTAQLLTVAHATYPSIEFRENDETLPAGRWRWTLDADVMRLRHNTAVAGDFSTYATPISISSTNVATIIGSSSLNVLKTGDSMTGALTISKVDANLHLNNTATNSYVLLKFQQGGLDRWGLIKSNTAESGSNTGSNFNLSRYDDAGAYIDAPLVVTRSTGRTALTGLDVSAAAGSIGINASTAASQATLTLNQGGVNRWGIYKSNAAESGSNAGSNFAIGRYTDAGAYIDTPVTINRASGLTTLTSLTVTGATTVATPTLDAHAATKAYVDTAVVSAASGLAIVVVSATTQAAVAGTLYALSNASAATTVTLPAAPTVGDTVSVMNTTDRIDHVIARNGKLLMGLAEDMTINSPNITITLRFISEAIGWRII